MTEAREERAVLWSAIIPGRPVVKKNSRVHLTRTNRQTGKRYTVPVPSRAYQAWESALVAEVFRAYADRVPTIREPVHLEATFWEHPHQRGDLGGYFESLCDGLQRAKILANDRLVRGALLHEIQRDPHRPRIEVALHPIGP